MEVIRAIYTDGRVETEGRVVVRSVHTCDHKLTLRAAQSQTFWTAHFVTL